MHLIITYYGAKEVLLPGPTMKLRQKSTFVIGVIQFTGEFCSMANFRFLVANGL